MTWRAACRRDCSEAEAGGAGAVCDGHCGTPRSYPAEHELHAALHRREQVPLVCFFGLISIKKILYRLGEGLETLTGAPFLFLFFINQRQKNPLPTGRRFRNLNRCILGWPCLVSLCNALAVPLHTYPAGYEGAPICPSWLSLGIRVALLVLMMMRCLCLWMTLVLG